MYLLFVFIFFRFVEGNKYTNYWHGEAIVSKARGKDAFLKTIPVKAKGNMQKEKKAGVMHPAMIVSLVRFEREAGALLGYLDEDGHLAPEAHMSAEVKSTRWFYPDRQEKASTR